MRMWMINPEYMCKKHIVGEHGEIHKHRHNFVKKHRMDKRLLLKQIFPAWMKIRHDELAQYMNHQSEFEQPDVSYLPNQGFVEFDFDDYKNNIFDLAYRCVDCCQIMHSKGLI